MAATILSTKLFIPPSRENVVARPHLIERLNEGLGRKLTIVSAPAGFGKTTLLSEWLAGRDQPPAWFSLDEGDNDPVRFWSHFIAALQTVLPDIAQGTFAALLAPQPPPLESILTSLLNEIAAIPKDLFLVLDDYHAFDSKQISPNLAFLIDRLPPRFHLVIATREDPNLPLARLRARDQLTELRVKDLRFTSAEAADFLTQTMGLRLAPEYITALESRTEGWIAGLQLAGLSMRGLNDIDGFIKSFTGSHRFVLDYLLEEVLHRQPEAIQMFLLQTAILERICGSLCEAVVANPSAEGQETLEYLERANLFIIPLDHERRWYRYHHLFSELLRARLVHAYPDLLTDLHRRASDWYAANGFPFEAVTHAIAVQDWPRAADIIERHFDELPMHTESATRLGWFEVFPPRLLLDRPGLGLVNAWALFMANQLDRSEKRLDQLAPLVQQDSSQLGELYAIRMMIVARRQDLPRVSELASQALALISPEEASPRSRILLTLGVAYDEMGAEIATAKNAFQEAYALGFASPTISTVGNAPLPLTALAYLADYESLQGNLHTASQMYAQALELAEKWGGQSSLAMCFVNQGRANLLYEWNDLDGAALALQESIRIGELWRNPRLLVPAYGFSALILHTLGQANEAQTMLHRAEQITTGAYATQHDLDFLKVYQIKLWTAQNDFQAIAQWKHNHETAWRLKFGRERGALATALAHAYIARYDRMRHNSDLSHARALIEPALEQAQASGLQLTWARLLMLDALALFAQGDTASAAKTLKQALAYAEPENFSRSFLDIGKPMQDFLAWSLENQSFTEAYLHEYVCSLLTQFDPNFLVNEKPTTRDQIVERLSQRELEVLRLIAIGLSNRQISERLYLALSTVKGHTRIIFNKLQVQRRTEAVARARELGLL